MAVAIRFHSATKNTVLADRYTVDKVVELIEAASAAGERVIVFDGKRGEHVVVSIGGTEPFTIREVGQSEVPQY